MIKVTIEQLLSRLPQGSLGTTDLGKALNRLPSLSEQGPWLAGGAIRRTVTGQPLDSDFDFFFKDEKQRDEFAAELVTLGATKTLTNEHNMVYVLPSKIETREDYAKIHHPELTIQLIHIRYYVSIEEVLDSFDFTACQFGFDGEHFYAADFTLWDVSRKKLVPHTITYATASLRRLIKYTSQGYTVCGGALSNILEQVVANPAIVEAETLYID